MSLGTGIALSVAVAWFALAAVLAIVLGRTIRRRDEQRPIEFDREGQTTQDSEHPETPHILRDKAVARGRRSWRRPGGLPRR